MIRTKPSTDVYRDGWDLVFGDRHEFMPDSETDPGRRGPSDETCRICGKDPRNAVHADPAPVSPVE